MCLGNPRPNLLVTGFLTRSVSKLLLCHVSSVACEVTEASLLRGASSTEKSMAAVADEKGIASSKGRRDMGIQEELMREEKLRQRALLLVPVCAPSSHDKRTSRCATSLSVTALSRRPSDEEMQQASKQAGELFPPVCRVVAAWPYLARRICPPGEACGCLYRVQQPGLAWPWCENVQWKLVSNDKCHTAAAQRFAERNSDTSMANPASQGRIRPGACR